MWNRVVLVALFIRVDGSQLLSRSDVGRGVRNAEETTTPNSKAAVTTDDVEHDSELGKATKTEDRIVGGQVIDITESPSTVRLTVVLENGASALCAGNLLSSWHVLTAAHCVTVDIKTIPDSYRVVRPENVVVRSGTSSLDSGGYGNYAQEIWVHPRFMRSSTVALYRDLAVIKLKFEVEPSKASRPAVVYRPPMSNETMAGTKCKVAGWGLMLENGGLSERLRQVTVTLRDREFCEERLKNLTDPEVHVCAKDEGRDSCGGDSGGGLYCDGRLLGVTSWGIGCAASPGVYARADTAVDFIDRIMNNTSFQCSCEPSPYSNPYRSLLDTPRYIYNYI